MGCGRMSRPGKVYERMQNETIGDVVRSIGYHLSKAGSDTPTYKSRLNKGD